MGSFEQAQALHWSIATVIAWDVLIAVAFTGGSPAQFGKRVDR
ncbi:hypothetical protein [Bradyrhizobium sp. sGM-13]|nr:hypothetical protein [Bradyrhizobium sp. sGM-13]